MYGLYLFWVLVAHLGDFFLQKGLDLEFAHNGSAIKEELGGIIATFGARLKNYGIRKIKKGCW